MATKLNQTSCTVPPQQPAAPKPPEVATSSVAFTLVPAPATEQKLLTFGIKIGLGQASFAGCANDKV